VYSGIFCMVESGQLHVEGDKLVTMTSGGVR
jgi:hypothetical protein